METKMTTEALALLLDLEKKYNELTNELLKGELPMEERSSRYESIICAKKGELARLFSGSNLDTSNPEVAKADQVVSHKEAVQAAEYKPVHGYDINANPQSEVDLPDKFPEKDNVSLTKEIISSSCETGTANILEPSNVKEFYPKTGPIRELGVIMESVDETQENLEKLTDSNKSNLSTQLIHQEQAVEGAECHANVNANDHEGFNDMNINETQDAGNTDILSSEVIYGKQTEDMAESHLIENGRDSIDMSVAEFQLESTPVCDTDHTHDKTKTSIFKLTTEASSEVCNNLTNEFEESKDDEIIEMPEKGQDRKEQISDTELSDSSQVTCIDVSKEIVEQKRDKLPKEVKGSGNASEYSEKDVKPKKENARTSYEINSKGSSNKEKWDGKSPNGLQSTRENKSEKGSKPTSAYKPSKNTRDDLVHMVLLGDNSYAKAVNVYERKILFDARIAAKDDGWFFVVHRFYLSVMSKTMLEFFSKYPNGKDIFILPTDRRTLMRAILFLYGGNFSCRKKDFEKLSGFLNWMGIDYALARKRSPRNGGLHFHQLISEKIEKGMILRKLDQASA